MEMIKGKILWVDDEIELLRPHIILLQQKNYNVIIQFHHQPKGFCL